MRFAWFLIICTAVALLRFMDEVSAGGLANPSDAPASAPEGAAAAGPGAGADGQAAPSSAPAGAPGVTASEGGGKGDDNGGGDRKEGDDDNGDDEGDDGGDNEGGKGGVVKGGGDDKNDGGDAEGNDNDGEDGEDTGDENTGDDDGKGHDGDGDDDGKGGNKGGDDNNDNGGDGNKADKSGDSGQDDDSNTDGNNSPSKGDWPYHYRKRCQDVHGNFRPLATICTNELEDEICTIMFPPDKDDPHARPRKCDLIGVNCLALKCAKHCKICCELAAHGCGDNPEMRINCIARKDDCDTMPTAMRIACAGTCGLCNKGGCRDNMDGCIALRSVCRRSVLRSDMAKKCSRSCGFCDAKCRDTGLNCKAGKMRGDCFRNGYRQMMKEVCTDTCGYCTNRPFVGGDAGSIGGGGLLDYVGGSRGQNKRQKYANVDLST